MAKIIVINLKLPYKIIKVSAGQEDSLIFIREYTLPGSVILAAVTPINTVILTVILCWYMLCHSQTKY